MDRSRSSKSNVDAKEVKEAIREKKVVPERKKQLLPTGSTLLNLALSDAYNGGIVPGSLSNIVGDSFAGKTLILWTMFAEIARHPHFKHYRLIYDESEASFYMNIDKLFGLSEGRVEVNTCSDTIQSFYQNVLRAINDGRPFIYGLDSLDGISSLEEKERAGEIAEGKEAGGSYKIEKARWMSEIMRNIVDPLEKTDSAVIIISQTRDNIGATFGEKKTRSGGRALRFYSTYEYWLSVIGHEKIKNREIGANIALSVKKNKYTGKRRSIDFPIYFSYGVDDLGSCVDFLVKEGAWTKSGSRITTANDLFPDGQRKNIIQHIEENNLEDKLREFVGVVWNSIEKSLDLERKPRYTTNDIF